MKQYKQMSFTEWKEPQECQILTKFIYFKNTVEHSLQ